MSRFVIVSFYTKGNGYDREAARLEESLTAFNVDHYIEAIESLGDWMRNAHFTHAFLRRMLEKFAYRPIVWTDADSVLRRYPELFDSLDCDFAAHMHDWRKWGKRELLCGTMFFGNTPEARMFLDDCITMDRCRSDRRGAFNLREVFDLWDGRLRFRHLPAQYCKIFDLMSDVLDPVFEHFQASRRFRRATRAATMRFPARAMAGKPAKEKR